MISHYSLISLIGYILFYLGTFLALPAVFERYDPVGLNFSKPLPNRQSTANLFRLGIGLLTWVAGGILQVWAGFC